MSELGYPNVNVRQWFGIVGPAGMPAEVAKKLNAEFIKAAHSEEVSHMLTSQATEVFTSSPEEFTAALYGYLARTPALLVGVSLAEAAGERRPQNMPGTVDEYPNWRIPLSDSEGGPVLLEDLPAHAGVASVISRIRGSR